jgi:hypothetical protein
MTHQAHAMYNLTLEQTTTLIAAGGHLRTVLAQGDMGWGKSSILHEIARRKPTHTACYFDCTTKDLGDITIPKMKELDGQDFVRFATNEELGLHLHDHPVIIMIDELGKANPMVQNALLRLMLERKMGSYTLHPDSIVFATTNLGAEGVGDILKPHARNRLTVVTVKKSTAMEWIEWGINNNIDPVLLGWVKDNPQVAQSFLDVENPDDNPYIYHPRSQRAAFVTGRSLEAASDWLKLRGSLDNTTLTAALMGTIGDRAAMDLMAFVRLAEDLPTMASIKNSPETAVVPKSVAAVCMVVFRTLTSIEADWIDAWMTYLERLEAEAQGMFANGVRAPKYSKQGLVMTNKKFTTWARSNSHLFAADV